MNPYAMLASGTNTSTASALAGRLAEWHDAMVAHERRLRTGHTRDVCDEECPHVEARTLWAEASVAFGEGAHDLTFLRSRATSARPPARKAVTPPNPGADPISNGRLSDRERKWETRGPRTRPHIDSSRESRHTTTEAGL